MNAWQASKEYNVPKTTLYSKLEEMDIESTPPNNITPAIEAVTSGVMNAKQASKKFKVPQSTLYSKVKKQRQTK
jgi:transcriptional regulator of acetoin/glycerol metabolism